MAGPANPFSGLYQKDGAANTAGRGRGGAFGRPTHQQARNVNANAPSGLPRDPRMRGRGRGASATTRSTRGNGKGASPAPSNAWRGRPEAKQNADATTSSPFAQLKNQNPPLSVQKSPFVGFGKASPQPSGSPAGLNESMVDSSRDPRRRPSSKPSNAPVAASVPVEAASFLNGYTDRYEQLKLDRAKQREQAIKAGQMADPNQPTSLKQAITPVGTCTSMCPEFERVERIVQKMVDKSEKFLHPSTNSLQNMEGKMLKRFRRSAAGYDEQLPSDIRTPQTLLQTMNYLIRHVLDGPDPLGLIHKFVWDRTRSIRNDFSVQQLTQEEHVKIAVTCLERIARFHIVSLHLLSSPANEEPFDRHQEREQLNNTMLSLMYYYDDNRGRIFFPNEDEFRAYYIIFSIHDQRPDLEARVQRWPPELRNSPRVQVALELFAAAGNTWEYQGTLDAKRPNAIAQGFYARFFSLIDSPGVSYLMACVAEIYFNHMRQTAIRSIWKGYCRYPSSQQHKNEEWTVEELTTVLYFDDDDQTIKFCEEQDLQFSENPNGDLYLNWGSRPIDSVAFQPSSDHSFSETYVESKRAGRTLVAIILGLNIQEAAQLGMIDSSLLPEQLSDMSMPEPETSVINDDSLFVSDEGNEIPTPSFQMNGPITGSTTINELATPVSRLDTGLSNFLQSTSTTKAETAPTFSFSQPQTQNQPSLNTSISTSLFPNGNSSKISLASTTPSVPHEPQISKPSNPFASIFPSANSNNSSSEVKTSEIFPNTNSFTSFPPAAPPVNPFTKPSSAFALPSQTPEAVKETSSTTSPPAALQEQQRPFVHKVDASSQNENDTIPSANTATSHFRFPSAFQSSTGSSMSPFDISPTLPGKETNQSSAGQFTNIFNSAKPQFQSENSTPLFSLSANTTMPKEIDVQETPVKDLEKEPSSTQSPCFPPFSSEHKNENSSALFATPEAPTRPDSTSKTSLSTASTSIIQEGPPASQVVSPFRKEATQMLPSTKQSSSAFNNALVDQEQPSRQATRESTASPPNTKMGVSIVDSSVSAGTTDEAQPEDVIQRRLAWIEALKEAADRRREVPNSTTRKRSFDEPEDIPKEVHAKAPKVSKPEVPSYRKSMALSSIKPLPKLPILEMVESMTARIPVEEKAEPPRPNQVDEDELLLSAARIAAESLRSGPRLLDGWPAPYDPPGSAFSPGSSVVSSVAFSRSQSPQSSSVNGFDVAFAPDSDLGLGRTMSRTEQRIRLTGGKGLAYKPLNFTPEKVRKTQKK